MTSEFVYEDCPFKCEHFEKVLVDKRGKASAIRAAKIGIAFHAGTCRLNPSRTISEEERHINELLGKRDM